MATYDLNQDELIQAMQTDVRMVLGFYIGDEIDLEIPEMHCEIWDELYALVQRINDPKHLVGTLNKLLAIPREHSKTTLIKLAVVLFLRYSRLSFCAYVSNTAPIAHNAIKDIRDYFMCSNETALYGASVIHRASESEMSYLIDIRVPGKLESKRVILKAFGQGTQLRGFVIDNKRPDLLIYDDIESRETLESPVLQPRLDAWALGTAYKAMARRGICIFIGNMLGDTSLLARLSKDPSWNPTVLGAIIRDKMGVIRPLWPARWTLEALAADYDSYRRVGLGHIWESEMMNLTAEQILGESLSHAYRPPRPSPEEIVSGFITVDPSFGKNSWNDNTALTVHVKVADQDTMSPIPLIVASVVGRFVEEEMFDKLLELSYYWGVTTWTIESVAAQRLLIPLFQSYMQIRQLPMELFNMIPVHVGKESKATRILAMRTAISRGSYGVVQEEVELMSHFEMYSPLTTEKDDDIDSAAQGLIVWAQDGATIEMRGVTNVIGAVMGATVASGPWEPVGHRVP